MKLSVIVPVYNEKNTILEVLNRLQKLEIDKEIIVIDDGSTDGTREILNNLQLTTQDSLPARLQHDLGPTARIQGSQSGTSGRGNLQIIFHEKNQGKGKAIQTGLKHSTGDVICIQDADLEYNPEQIPNLLSAFSDDSVDAVLGSRFLHQNPNLYRRYLWGNKFLTRLINLFYGSNYTDSYTGYKLVRRKVFNQLNLKSTKFEIEAEIAIKLKKFGANVIELPINYTPRTIEEGKKIGWKDAIKGIITILKFLRSHYRCHCEPRIKYGAKQSGHFY